MIGKPDNAELGIRFGCGFAAGILLAALGLVSLFRFEIFQFPGWAIVFVVLGAAGVCGCLAAKKGDNFWYSLKEWLS